MLSPDVNVLVYAHRADAPRHEEYRRWLHELVNGAAPFGLADPVLSGFLRVVTHPRVFAQPSSIDVALAFAETLRGAPRCVRLVPGPRHWEIFARFVRTTRATGNAVPDAWLAALAVETGSEWVTTDGGFARFRGLRSRHPLL